MIITICGSTRFKETMMKVAEDLTMMGHIVLMPNVFHHSDKVELSDEEKIRLDNLHREKINMSDAIFVVNVDNYIGKSTYGEIDWAGRMKKEIIFLNPVDQPESEDEAKEKEEVE